jgi:hypothetical protein
VYDQKGLFLLCFRVSSERKLKQFETPPTLPRTAPLLKALIHSTRIKPSFLTKPSNYTMVAASPYYSSPASWQDPSTRAVDPFASPKPLSHSSTGSHKKQSPAEISQMKGRRKRRTVVSGVAGGIVGLVALGPLGMIAGGVGSAVVAKRVGKRNEKRRMDEIEAQQNPLRTNGSGEML